MTFGAILKTIFVFLPELINLIKSLTAGVKAGIEITVLKHRIKAIEQAFSHSDRRRAARELNDVFKK